jgi:hypothetical protein
MVNFRLTLSARNRRALHKLHRLATRLAVTLSAPGHLPRTQTKRVMLKG